MTLPHDPAQAVGVAPPNELTINIKVTPANAAGAVSFRRAGDEPDCLAFVGNPVVKGNGVIELKIQAVTPSTPANGGGRKPNGTLIEAVHNNKVIGIGKYYVIKPASIKTGTPGQIILEMSAKPAEVGTFRLRAEYEGQCVDPGLQQHQAPPATFPPAGQPGAPKYYVEFIPIEILDQYNMPLGGMYSDTAVREGGTWMAWMGSGSYLDPQGCGGNKVSDGYIEIYVAGYYCGDCNTRLTIANDNGTTADFKVEWL
jgi:hypothetical protein